MLIDFLKYIEEHHLIKKGDRILLAVSGGIDSMVMAHLFTRTSFRTGIAHCNFCLRGNESDMDEDLVRKFAADNDIPFHTKHFDTKRYAEVRGISVQMAARDLRYRWFEEIMKKHRFHRTAVAHNLDDNIETILINLTRGTGITGLTGIRPENRGIIRPLLFATREAISIYCSENNIRYREDRSNAETIYTRNKIRHKVIPVLREINPSVKHTLQRTADRLKITDEIVAEFIGGLKKKAVREKNGETIISLTTLKSYRENPAVLYELTEEYGMTGPLIPVLIKIISGRTGSRIFTATHRIIKNRQELIITPVSTGLYEPLIINDLADLKKASVFSSVISVKITLNFKIPSGPGVACLDQSKVVFPMVIRKWKAGDSFFPFGMKNRKKLSDYFTDHKYSLAGKEKALILESEGRIVWIIGERIDDRFRITPETKKALIINSILP